MGSLVLPLSRRMESDSRRNQRATMRELDITVFTHLMAQNKKSDISLENKVSESLMELAFPVEVKMLRRPYLLMKQEKKKRMIMSTMRILCRSLLLLTLMTILIRSSTSRLEILLDIWRRECSKPPRPHLPVFQLPHQTEDSSLPARLSWRGSLKVTTSGSAPNNLVTIKDCCAIQTILSYYMSLSMFFHVLNKLKR